MSAPCAGCRRCGCGPTDDPAVDYDFTCEVCGCGPSMDPAPAAALVAAEKALLDAALAAPAVPVGVPDAKRCREHYHCDGSHAAPIRPVGVQPEPAEEEVIGRWTPAGNPEKFTGCDAPAVPVVHPEPGDRADALDQAIWDLHIADLSQYDIQRIVRMVALPAVAAAVTAVRAELADQIEARRKDLRSMGDPQAFRNNGLNIAAAIVRGGSS